MMLLYCYIIPFLIFRLYGFEYLRFSIKNKNRFSLIISKKIKNLHYLTTLCSLILLLIEIKFNYKINVIWIKRVFIIFSFISGILMVSFINEMSTNKIEKIYFKIFSYLPILISLIWLIPLWGLFICYSFFCTLFNPIKIVYYEQNNIKIQSSYFNPMAPAKIEVYKKGLFFSKEITLKEDKIYELDSVKVEYKNQKINVSCPMK